MFYVPKAIKAIFLSALIGAISVEQSHQFPWGFPLKCALPFLFIFTLQPVTKGGSESAYKWVGETQWPGKAGWVRGAGWGPCPPPPLPRQTHREPRFFPFILRGSPWTGQYPDRADSEDSVPILLTQQTISIMKARMDSGPALFIAGIQTGAEHPGTSRQRSIVSLRAWPVSAENGSWAGPISPGALPSHLPGIRLLRLQFLFLVKRWRQRWDREAEIEWKKEAPN